METDYLTYRPANVVALFLIHFDVKYGYNLVWNKTTEALDLNGVEYKVLPSGLQDKENDTILISQVSGNSIYYGLGRYRQRITGLRDGNSNSRERNNVKMYSLGILCKPSSNNIWTFNEYICNGWEYVSDLDSTLKEFLLQLNYEDMSIFDHLFNNLTGHALTVDRPSKSIDLHLLRQLDLMFETLGPLVFTLYKQALLRKRLIIFHKAHSKIDNFALASFTYLLSLLSLIPKRARPLTVQSITESRPIYNIGLNDLDSPLLEEKATIASTNDDILMYQVDVFDCGIFLPDHENECPFILRSDDLNGSMRSPLELSSKSIRATYKDYNKFKYIYKELHGFNTKVSDDTSSARSSESFLSVAMSWFRMSTFKHLTCVFDEPLWWLKKASDPLSWREYIWSAFSWLASAGYMSDGIDPQDNNNISSLNTYLEVEEAENLSRVDSSNSETLLNDKFLRNIEVVSYFHATTWRWFYVINDIIQESLKDESESSHSESENVSPENRKIVIEITFQDIKEMGLDPYAEQDLQFLREFVSLYWSSVVESVNFTIGVGEICGGMTLIP